MKSFLKTTAAALTLIPLPALAVNYPQDVDQFSHITDMPLNEREILLAAAFMMITAVGLTGFVFARHFSARTLLAFIMTCVFVSIVALIFIFSTAYSASPVFGLVAMVAMLFLFKLMNQFEIKR
jgi:hypothetical protein